MELKLIETEKMNTMLYIRKYMMPDHQMISIIYSVQTENKMILYNILTWQSNI